MKKLAGLWITVFILLPAAFGQTPEATCRKACPECALLCEQNMLKCVGPAAHAASHLANQGGVPVDPDCKTAETKCFKNCPAPPPVFSSASGAGVCPWNVSISASPGTDVFYTLDSSAPTTASAKYTGPITIKGKTTIRAIASVAGSHISSVASGVYSCTPKVNLVIETHSAEGTFMERGDADVEQKPFRAKWTGTIVLKASAEDITGLVRLGIATPFNCQLSVSKDVVQTQSYDGNGGYDPKLPGQHPTTETFVLPTINLSTLCPTGQTISLLEVSACATNMDGNTMCTRTATFALE